MERNHTIRYNDIEFHGTTQALAIANVSQHRLNTAIDMARELEAFSYKNVRAHYEAGNLGAWLCSLAPSELAQVLSNTVNVLHERGRNESVMDVYNRYFNDHMKPFQEQEAARKLAEYNELVALEATYGDCPEAIQERNNRWQDALASYI